MTHYTAHPSRIPITLIEPNPDNPRLAIYKETVESFCVRLRGAGDGYPAESAIKVRSLDGGRYQVIDGHHRFDAALAEGLDHVMAFVGEMTNEEALGELLMSNIQNGLTPLEIGLHLLRLQSGQGRAGAGLEGFAKTIGKAPAQLRRYRHAAQAFDAAREQLSPEQVLACRDRAEALAEIGRGTPRDRWPELVRRCADENWTAAQAKRVIAENVAGSAETVHRDAKPQPAPTPRTLSRPRGTRNSKSQLVSVRMPLALHANLRQHAAAHRMKVGALVKKAIEAGLPLALEQLAQDMASK